jgi:hypothetical protein
MKTIARLAAEDAIDSLRAVSVAAGYTTDPVVEELRKGGVSPSDGKWVVIVGEPKPRADAPYQFEHVDQPIAIECFHLPLNADPRSVADRLSQMAGDVRRKLREDVRRGGYAFYTDFGADEYNADEAPFFVRVNANFRVRYRLNDPYSQ